MKKYLLFAFCLLTFGFQAFAQPQLPNTLVLYSGDKSIDFINGEPYGFDNGLAIFESGTTDKFYSMIGKTDVAKPYFVGSAGAGSYDPTSNPTIDYLGQVANTSVAFTSVSQGKDLKLSIAFASDDQSKVWGYEFALPASTTPVMLTAPLGLFKLRDNSKAFSGAVITEADLATVSKFEFGLTNLSDGGVGVAELHFDNFMLLDTYLTGTSNSNISNAFFFVYPNPCNTGILNLGESEVSYTLSTAIGVVAKSGVGHKVDVSNLEKGMYLISTSNGKMAKVILN